MAADIAQFLKHLKNRVYIMMLEYNVAEDLSNMQNRKPAASHIFMSTLFHKRKVIQKYSD